MCLMVRGCVVAWLKMNSWEGFEILVVKGIQLLGHVGELFLAL